MFVILLLTFIILVFGGMIYVVRLPWFRISDIQVEGTVVLFPDEIRNEVIQEFSGSSFLVVPNDSYFAVSTRRLQQKIYKKFLKIKEVKIWKTLKPSLHVAISEREIWGIGCAKTEVAEVERGAPPKGGESKTTTGPCFYIDREGFAFEDVSSFAGGLFPIIYKEGPGGAGADFVYSSDVGFFEEVNSKLKTVLNFSPVSMETFSQNAEDARFLLKEGWSLLVPRDKDPAGWLAVLKTLLDEEIKGRKNKLEYVDLRFGNKVFYKFR